jgi:DNA-binding transcriptional LysR family regulator
MEISRLRALRELAKRKTMAAVADALFVSASAVSQQISQLEDEAGVPLITRRGRGVRLTEAGERLVAHAERIIGILEEAKTDLAELKKIVAGEVRLAAFPSIASALAPAAMKELETYHPRLRVVLNVMEPMEGLAALRAWQTDLAIVDDLTVDPSSADRNVEKAYLCDDRLYAILPASHPLAAKSSIHLYELAEAKWALDVASNKYSEVIMAACHQAGFEPAVNAYCNGFEVVVSLIEAGCSVSVMPGLRLKSYRGEVVSIPVVPEIKRQIFAAVRAGETRNPGIAALLRALKSAVALQLSVDEAAARNGVL